MNRLEQYLAGKLDERKAAGNLRQLTSNRATVDFFSNDYLGLATTGALSALMHVPGEATHITGSTGSRLLSGNSKLAEEVEQMTASFHQAEAALLFNSGYDANTGLLASVAGRTATILTDELCHASIIDGARLSMAKRYRFAHNDTADLEDKLKKYSTGGPVIVAVESVYSMDGDMAPLAEIMQLCEAYDAQLIVDEAHATGIFGDKGAGVVSQLGLQDRVFARVHTFGKALGCHGAIVAGSDALKQYLINFARPFIYTTALPGHSLVAIYSAYQYLSGHSFTNKALHELIAYFRKRISDSNIKGWKDSISPIQALITGGNERSRALAMQLQKAGLQVNAILHPTVPEGMERLRICLHTFNTKEQVDLLFDVIEQ